MIPLFNCIPKTELISLIVQGLENKIILTKFYQLKNQLLSSYLLIF